MSGGVPIHACYMASGFPPIAGQMAGYIPFHHLTF